MQKAIHLENSNKSIVRILSIADPDIITNNPTGIPYILIEDFIEAPELQNNMSINYPMYDNVNKQFKWIQVQYQNGATEERVKIENLELENNRLKDELDSIKNDLNLANENIDILIELQADIIGGAI